MLPCGKWKTPEKQETETGNGNRHGNGTDDEHLCFVFSKNSVMPSKNKETPAISNDVNLLVKVDSGKKLFRATCQVVYRLNMQKAELSGM